MRLAILGGTFNPPHFGHLFFANEVRQKLKYDKIVFIPTFISAHKIDSLSIDSNNRYEMLKIATEKFNWADVSDCDIIRGGITRTIDTIRDIKKLYNLTSKPGFIIGDDLVKKFNKWKDPDLIAENADLIVGYRNNKEIKFTYKHITIENRVFPLSSSEIRNRINNNYDVDFLLPDKVIKYIREKRLYK